MYCDQELEVNDTGEIKTMVDVCRECGVTKVPSWGKYTPNASNITLQVGFLSLEKLKEFTGC